MLKENEYLKKIAENFLSNLKKSGASEASVLISNTISESVNVRNKKLDGSTRSDSMNVVLTAYVGKKKIINFIFKFRGKPYEWIN